VSITKESLTVSLIVRRVARGAAPFGWEVLRTDMEQVVHASTERFGSMAAAYTAGGCAAGGFHPQKAVGAPRVKSRFARLVSRGIEEDHEFRQPLSHLSASRAACLRRPARSVQRRPRSAASRRPLLVDHDPPDTINLLYANGRYHPGDLPNQVTAMTAASNPGLQ
jgi:hypothetical protein